MIEIQRINVVRLCYLTGISETELIETNVYLVITLKVFVDEIHSVMIYTMHVK